MIAVAATQELPRTFASNEDRWAAVAGRNTAADGAFYYAVRTTGVYCRPSCGARLPNRNNVSFHLTCDDAESAGYRPCKRCRPREASLEARRASGVARACRLIERSESEPTLDDLATAAGMSRFHFHRVFKQVTGLTPKAYASAHRADRVRRALTRRERVTDAIYDAGFNSNGRFYETSAKELGMTPTSYRAGGSGASVRFAVGECSLGSILVAASQKGICAILLGDDPDSLVRILEDRFPNAELTANDVQFEQWVARVIGFVEAPRLGLDLPLDLRGTAFQRRVWRALSKIPAGATASYSDVAKKIGAPGSARAVAQACASNSIAVAIPCHRVVRSDGGTSGYRWGVERKRALIAREARNVREADGRPAGSGTPRR